MIPRHLRSTLFPYTTLFRSDRTTEWPRTRLHTRHWRKCSVRRKKTNQMLPLQTSYFGRSEVINFRSRCCQIRSEEHTSELQSRGHLVCRLLLEKKKT